MKNEQLLNIKILPNADNPLFEQRESGVTHTSYYEETAFYSFVQQGNTDMVRAALKKYLTSEIVVGHLSDNSVRQMQYWAVCCVTLGIRYSIQGGLDEMTAYNLSDSYIMQIDRLDSAEKICEYIGKIVVELTELVRKNAHTDCPSKIRKCLKYIDDNLHSAIRLSDLAEVSALSEGYVSKSFKKYLGTTVSEYVLEKKLEAAKAMLKNDCDQKSVAYYLGFCSQTYFITCFKKAYGVTPGQFAKTVQE